MDIQKFIDQQVLAGPLMENDGIEYATIPKVKLEPPVRARNLDPVILGDLSLNRAPSGRLQPGKVAVRGAKCKGQE